MIGFLVIAAWIFLLAAWGGFWRADQRLPTAPDPARWPAVAVIIPARDEAATIAEVVQAHRASDYPGAVHLIVIDDGSSDGTGGLARTAGARVVVAPPLAHGWTGKLWAVHNGLAVVADTLPEVEWILLSDADIRHETGTLRKLVAAGEDRGLALVSLMARLDNRGTWAQLLIPAFVFFFQKLYPFAWVNRPGHWCAGAAGGCMLVRRTALQEIGGIAAIGGALIDDCTLAARLKHGPPKRAIWLGLAGDEVISLRDNRQFASIWDMVARTAYTQLRHSVWLLAGSVLGMTILYLTGPLLLVAGLIGGPATWIAQGAVLIGLTSLAYAPILRLYRQPLWQTLTLPVAAALYTAMTVSSAVRHWRGKGGQWKGRTYS